MNEAQENPHAELMAVAAEIAKTNLFWWEEFEYFDPSYCRSGWQKIALTSQMKFSPKFKYRLKPKKLKIYNKEIAIPIRSHRLRFENITKYYVPNFASETFISVFHMNEDRVVDDYYCSLGLMYANEKDAADCARAMLGLLNEALSEFEKPPEIEEKDFTTKRVYFPYP
ncbi:hypothetical protein [Arsenophonus sp.]|uniref:hypothetical protein n=1 Tax=Arsenophonus sp. TaxID=1872640 RepID=UPI0038794969